MFKTGVTSYIHAEDLDMMAAAAGFSSAQARLIQCASKGWTYMPSQLLTCGQHGAYSSSWARLGRHNVLT